MNTAANLLDFFRIPVVGFRKLERTIDRPLQRKPARVNQARRKLRSRESDAKAVEKGELCAADRFLRNGIERGVYHKTRNGFGG